MKEDMKALDKEMLQRLTVNWLDDPSIEGKLTPRQAVQSPEGRKKVIEALKQKSTSMTSAPWMAKVPPWMQTTFAGNLA